MDICCAELTERKGQKIQCHVEVVTDSGCSSKKGDPQRGRVRGQGLLQLWVAARAFLCQNKILSQK